MQASQEHNISGLINLFEIESPGLTSALAIAEHIANEKDDLAPDPTLLN